MIIKQFSKTDIENASLIAQSNYREECLQNDFLPIIESFPELTYFTETGLGVAAYEGSKMLGFLCFYEPWDNIFCTYVKGSFSPLHAHGAIPENRVNIYKYMYQKAAEMLIELNAVSHGIALYEHDIDGITAFFKYGFGQRCVDSLRDLSPIQTVVLNKYKYIKLGKGQEKTVRELREKLSRHLNSSPCFMYSDDNEFSEWLARAENRDSTLYTAFDGTHAIAFIEVTDEGENFVTYSPKMMNICGAYCLPQYRGSGVIQNLLNYLINDLQNNSMELLGVDFESFNAEGNAFWNKYFKAYTCSVVRRIDERTLENNKK